MRYIDLKKLLKNRPQWGNGGRLWKNKKLMEDFRNHGFNKCWYTEVVLLGQDPHIDHWRPKAKIKQFETYNYNNLLKKGYSWLANEPNNYRLCCLYANRKTGSGGKGCFFPLSFNSKYMTQRNNQKETPLLIDPCKKNDVKLITFLGGGAIPACASPLKKQKAQVSIKIYNIDDPNIKKARQNVWDDTFRLITMYKKKKIEFNACIEQLTDKIDRKAQFSACAIACVLSLAPKRITNKLNSLLTL
jgi:hypothetical protein